jgi:cytochrome b
VSERTVPIRVWDLPTRLFHWAIVVLLGVSWLSESLGWMELHFLSGYSTIALLLFRLGWGFVGSETSRFARFLRSPLTGLRYLASFRRLGPDTEIGHNAAGGWMVLVLLALLAVQAGTGLFANDDGDTEGPLFRYVSKDQSDWLSHIHSINFTLIQIAVCVHIVAVLAYLVLKRHDLLRPMITGRKYLPEGVSPPLLVGLPRAAILLAIAIAVVVVALRLG